MAMINGGDEIVTKSKLQDELHRFYRTIRKYLNGTGTGAGIVTYYDDLSERPVESDSVDMDTVCYPLPSEESGTLRNTGFNITVESNTNDNNVNIPINVTVGRVE